MDHEVVEVRLEGLEVRSRPSAEELGRRAGCHDPPARDHYDAVADEFNLRGDAARNQRGVAVGELPHEGAHLDDHRGRARWPVRQE